MQSYIERALSTSSNWRERYTRTETLNDLPFPGFIAEMASIKVGVVAPRGHVLNGWRSGNIRHWSRHPTWAAISEILSVVFPNRELQYIDFTNSTLAAIMAGKADASHPMKKYYPGVISRLGISFFQIVNTGKVVIYKSNLFSEKFPFALTRILRVEIFFFFICSLATLASSKVLQRYTRPSKPVIVEVCLGVLLQITAAFVTIAFAVKALPGEITSVHGLLTKLESGETKLLFYTPAIPNQLTTPSSYISANLANRFRRVINRDIRYFHRPDRVSTFHQLIAPNARYTYVRGIGASLNVLARLCGLTVHTLTDLPAEPRGIYHRPHKLLKNNSIEITQTMSNAILSRIFRLSQRLDCKVKGLGGPRRTLPLLQLRPIFLLFLGICFIGILQALLEILVAVSARIL